MKGSSHSSTVLWHPQPPNLPPTRPVRSGKFSALILIFNLIVCLGGKAGYGPSNISPARISQRVDDKIFKQLLSLVEFLTVSKLGR